MKNSKVSNIYNPKEVYGDVQYKLGLDDAKELVCQYIVENATDIDYTNALQLTNNDILVTWWCYILGGWKCLLSTDRPDGMYYEVTYNHTKNELYLDAYKREKNVQYSVEIK